MDISLIIAFSVIALILVIILGAILVFDYQKQKKKLQVDRSIWKRYILRWYRKFRIFYLCPIVFTALAYKYNPDVYFTAMAYIVIYLLNKLAA